VTFPLRDYQEELLNEARKALRRSKRVLIQLPTGGGKTAIGTKAIANAVSKGHRAWMMLHRRELVKQTIVTFDQFAGLPLGVVAAGFPGNRHQPVQVCSIGTVARRLDLLPAPTFIEWDECHHLAAASWAAVMAKFPEAYHVGLSATPERLDGAGLDKYFDEIVCGPTVRELIDGGWLSDYKLYAPKGADLSGVHTVAGDYNKKELSAAMSRSTVTGDALTHYLKHCRGARAILFAWSIESSTEIARQFADAGIAAEHVDGTTDDSVRDLAVERFKRGELKVLTNVDLFGEGFDVPAVEAVFDLAPTKSLAKYLQRCGRALRPAPGKDVALLFDHAGNSKLHGLPDADREWTLAGRKRAASKSDGPPVKQCPLCYAVVAAAASVCRHCSYKFQVEQRPIEQVEGELAEVDKDFVREMRMREQGMADSLEKLIAVGRSRGYKNPEKWAGTIMAHRKAKQAATEAARWARGMVA
jgi:superfamily II DNA or RNA helicase